MIRRYRDTDFITALRALAATLVVMIHTGALRDYGWIGKNIMGAGSGGVYIFFVIAGFSVTQAYMSAASYQDYLIRRFFRIAPAYYTVITAVFLMIVFGAVAVPSIATSINVYDSYNLLLHYMFLSFVDNRIANSILSVEWTLPIEFFWYILLIPAISKPRSWSWLFLFTGLLFALSVLTKELTIYFWSSKLHYIPTLYGYYFALGILAHKFRAKIPDSMTEFRPYLFYAGLALLVGAIVFGVGNAAKMAAIYTSLIICGYHKPHKAIKILFENKIVLFLGTISYGLYLLHFPTIYVLRSLNIINDGILGFALVYSISVLLATILYFLIEAPFNKWGRQVAQKYVSQHKR